MVQVLQAARSLLTSRLGGPLQLESRQSNSNQVLRVPSPRGSVAPCFARVFGVNRINKARGAYASVYVCVCVRSSLEAPDDALQKAALGMGKSPADQKQPRRPKLPPTWSSWLKRRLRKSSATTVSASATFASRSGLVRCRACRCVYLFVGVFFCS